MAKAKTGPSVRGQARAFIDRLRRQVAAGLAGAAGTHSAIVAEKISEHQTSPVGSHRRRGETFKGQVVERSAPGEYPWREFGDTSESVRFKVDRRKLIAASGVTPDGMALVHLEFGHHWVSGEAFERLGLVAAYHEFKPRIAQAFLDGFNSGV